MPSPPLTYTHLRMMQPYRHERVVMLSSTDDADFLPQNGATHPFSPLDIVASTSQEVTALTCG